MHNVIIVYILCMYFYLFIYLDGGIENVGRAST